MCIRYTKNWASFTLPGCPTSNPTSSSLHFLLYVCFFLSFLGLKPQWLWKLGTLSPEKHTHTQCVYTVLQGMVEMIRGGNYLKVKKGSEYLFPSVLQT